MQDDVSRPVVLYVEQIDPHPQPITVIENRRVSVIDLQLSAAHATILIEYLREQKDAIEPNKYIRLRFMGKLIHV
jgi:hypothetical protein